MYHNPIEIPVTRRATPPGPRGSRGYIPPCYKEPNAKKNKRISFSTVLRSCEDAYQCMSRFQTALFVLTPIIFVWVKLLDNIYQQNKDYIFCIYGQYLDQNVFVCFILYAYNSFSDKYILTFKLKKAIKSVENFLIAVSKKRRTPIFHLKFAQTTLFKKFL